MSCPNSCTSCPLTNKVVGVPCAPKYFQCPVVCTPSVPDVETLPTGLQLLLSALPNILEAFQNPATYSSSCGDVLGQLVCVEQQTIPFTGQTVYTITIDLSSVAEGLCPVSISIYEKCGTFWFKIPSIVFLDTTYACEYPGSIGSVSITKSSECPDKWNARILIDGFCWPINVEVTTKQELVNQCGCPPFIRHAADIKVESGFEKFLHTQSIQCLNSDVLNSLVGVAVVLQIQALYQQYVLSQQDFIKASCCNTICAIGEQCGGYACTSSSD